MARRGGMEMDEIKSLLVAMLESQGEILVKMDHIEARFNDIVFRIEQYTERQIKLEKEVDEFKSTIVEQVSKQLLRTKNIYH